MEKHGPAPHYLQEVVSETEYCIVGTVLFPTDDPTLIERRQVNTAQQLLAVWNLAHFALRNRPFKHPLVCGLNAYHKKRVLKDKSYIFIMTGDIDGKAKGNIDVIVIDASGHTCSTFHIEFSCLPEEELTDP